MSQFVFFVDFGDGFAQFSLTVKRVKSTKYMTEEPFILAMKIHPFWQAYPSLTTIIMHCLYGQINFPNIYTLTCIVVTFVVTVTVTVTECDEFIFEYWNIGTYKYSNIFEYWNIQIFKYIRIFVHVIFYKFDTLNCNYKHYKCIQGSPQKNIVDHLVFFHHLNCAFWGL